MPLNESRGNMYPFVTHTWNAIKGKCPHDCSYCYMKKWGKQKPLRLVESELNNVTFPPDAFIFVGSSTDMWCEDVPDELIGRVLDKCRLYPTIKYLFQTKNPARFKEWLYALPPFSTLACTMESNRCWGGSTAPCPCFRAEEMKGIPGRKMISIEPIMDFDLETFVTMIKDTEPTFVSIGANTSTVKLPEPSPEKVAALIAELSEFTEIVQKKNLGRLLKC